MDNDTKGLLVIAGLLGAAYGLYSLSEKPKKQKATKKKKDSVTKSVSENENGTTTRYQGDGFDITIEDNSWIESNGKKKPIKSNNNVIINGKRY